jgi:hypothetical protein
VCLFGFFKEGRVVAIAGDCERLHGERIVGVLKNRFFPSLPTVEDFFCVSFNEG